MPHQTALIATIAASLGLAFVFGFVATRLRLPPLVGYLVAGIAVGPFTPGYVADTGLASQLAEIGVILLMFGVGMHFSVRDLLAVRWIAVPGAIAQIVVATALGAGAARMWGWSWGSALLFGLSLSVASTVVLLRELEQQGTLDSIHGRVAVGWLIVEDLAMVLALVLLPALAGPLGGAAPPTSDESLLATLALTAGKVVVFVLLMLFVGGRAVPWLVARVARTGSRELFTVGVLAVALGIAFGAAALFDVSFALGAFLAGVVISESDLSQQAAADALPLQDAFAVLFFVSVGMLFDPAVVVSQPLAVLVTLLVIIVGKAAVAFFIVLLFRYPLRTAAIVSASLAQIGEFSFILAGLGRQLQLLPPSGPSLILAAAILSITLNPLAFVFARRLEAWLHAHPRLLGALERRRGLPVEPPSGALAEALHDHAVLVGFGRVGGVIGAALHEARVPYVAVEQNHEWVETARQAGFPVLFGDATRPGVLEHAQIQRARLLVVASPGAYSARRIVELARRANPEIDVVVRTHSEAEQRYLAEHGVVMAVVGERELALGMARYALTVAKVAPEDIDGILREARSPTR